jgi:hypothetical protein
MSNILYARYPIRSVFTYNAITVLHFLLVERVLSWVTATGWVLY